MSSKTMQETPFEVGKRQGLAGEKKPKSPYATHSQKWMRWWSGVQAGLIEREQSATAPVAAGPALVVEH